MASPKKVSSISLSATSLNDGGLPITKFDKTTLINFLNSVSSSQVAIFFNGDGSDNGSSNRLVIAGLDANGDPSASEQVSSAVLPCPPYCTG